MRVGRPGRGRVRSRAAMPRVTRVSEHVDIEIPLHARHASTVRAVAAAVCADLGFSVDAIDDLRLGVNEAVAILADVDAPADARLRITFAPSAEAVTVRAERRGVEETVVDADVDLLARRILDHVVDEYSLDHGAFVLVKRNGPAD